MKQILHKNMSATEAYQKLKPDPVYFTDRTLAYHSTG